MSFVSFCTFKIVLFVLLGMLDRISLLLSAYWFLLYFTFVDSDRSFFYSLSFLLSYLSPNPLPFRLGCIWYASSQFLFLLCVSTYHMLFQMCLAFLHFTFIVGFMPLSLSMSSRSYSLTITSFIPIHVTFASLHSLFFISKYSIFSLYIFFNTWLRLFYFFPLIPDLMCCSLSHYLVSVRLSSVRIAEVPQIIGNIELVCLFLLCLPLLFLSSSYPLSTFIFFLLILQLKEVGFYPW